jgi:hypothetical protein
MEKTCTGCAQTQPIENFNMKKGKRRTRCKECVSQYSSQLYRSRHPKKEVPQFQLSDAMLDELKWFPMVYVAKKHGVKYPLLSAAYAKHTADPID